MKQLTVSVASILLALVVGSGCEDKIVGTPASGTLSLDIEYVVGSEPLQMNEMIYTNSAGNVYSVSTMRYLLSDFTFRKADGSEVSSDTVFYVDADRDDLNNISFYGIPFSDYTGVSFVLGLQPELNVPSGLANVEDFNNMTWPEQMGGGYHFLQFEGHFIDSNAQMDGFAWHLGRDVSLMPFDLDHSFAFTTTSLNAGTLTMDIERFFSEPVNIDLDTTNFSMMNLSHMEMLATNGLDVFTLN